MRPLLFGLLMIALTPVLLVAYPFYHLPVLLKRGRVSGTTYEPFIGRLIYHLMGTREDRAALQLAPGLPATNPVVLALMVRPLAWAARVTGYTPAAFAYPPPNTTTMSMLLGVRCEFLDAALCEHVSAGDQVVILGAGWDTRAYGLLKGRDATVFEVDAPATQAVKRRALEKTGVDASHVTFVSCDFNRQAWLDALREHGFDPATRTFVLWEGVTMYLEEPAIQRLLQAVSTLPAGSRIAFDFFSREWLEGTMAGRAAHRAMRLFYGEPFLFGFPVTPDFSDRLSDYLEDQGLTLARACPMGNAHLPYGGLALAVTP